MAGEVILLNMAPAEELNAAYRLQQRLIDQFNLAPPTMTHTEFLAFRKDWDNRLHKLHTRVNELRAIVEPIKPGEKEDGPEQTARHARKIAARKSTAFDDALRNHPLLTAEPTEATEIDPLEDFTTYTEVDPNAHITVDSATQISITCWNDEVAYVRKDYGDGFFTDFEHLYDFRMVTHSGTAMGGVCMKATVLDHVFANPQDIAGTVAVEISAVYTIRLRHVLNGAQQAQDIMNAAHSTDYYCTETRAGSTLTLKVYSAATRLPGELLDTLTIDDDGTARRYVMPVVTRNSASALWISYIVRNLDLQLVTNHPFFFREYVEKRRRS